MEWLNSLLQIFHNPPKHTLPALLFISMLLNIYLYLRSGDFFGLAETPTLGVSKEKAVSDVTGDYVLPQMREAKAQYEKSKDPALYSDYLERLYRYEENANELAKKFPQNLTPDQKKEMTEQLKQGF